MKPYLFAVALFFAVSNICAEWALSVGDDCPNFTIYKYEDESYSTSEDIPGNVILYVFGSIT